MEIASTGVHEEGASPTKKEPPNISGTIPNLATLIRLIIEAQDLNDEQQRRVHEFLALHTQAYVESRNFSAAELELVVGFIEHVEKVYEVALMSANVGSLEIVLHCPTLKRLEHLWSDYLSGHLNEVAEKFLITDEIKRMLKLETIRLKTTIEEENYLKCRKALMEMSGAGLLNKLHQMRERAREELTQVQILKGKRNVTRAGWLELKRRKLQEVLCTKLLSEDNTKLSKCFLVMVKMWTKEISFL